MKAMTNFKKDNALGRRSHSVAKLSLFLFVSMFATFAFGQGLTVEHYYHSGGSADHTPHTFTVPVGVTAINVEVWAGGGGGGYASTIWDRGGGGAGGGYAVFKRYPVSPGQVFTVMVGRGGLGGSPGDEDRAQSGRYSAVMKGDIIVVRANGGQGGKSNGNRQASPDYAQGGIGMGYAGVLARPGSNGEHATDAYSGKGGNCAPDTDRPVGLPTKSGSGGARLTAKGNGNHGTNYGGGGSGGFKTLGYGGVGAPGLVRISYQINEFDAHDDIFARNVNHVGSLDLDVLLNDKVDGYTFTPALVQNPAHGAVVWNSTSKKFVYTPTSGYMGDDSFRYRLTYNGTHKYATVTIIASSLEMGCPTHEEGVYTFPLAAYTGYAHTISVNFTSATDGSYITLPSAPAGWEVHTVGEAATNSIVSAFASLPDNVTAVEIQSYIRGIAFHTPEGSVRTATIAVDGSNVEGQLFYSTHTQHFYQYFRYDLTSPHNPDGGLTWIDCYNKAKSMYWMGMRGYLATITSLEEDLFIRNLTGAIAWMGATRLSPYATDGTMHYAGFNLSTAVTPPSGAYWYWACGPERGRKVFPSVTAPTTATISYYNALPYYTNWKLVNPEPNNSGNPLLCNENGAYGIRRDEACAVILFQGEGVSTGSGYSWNDVTNELNYATDKRPGSPRGFLVEYGDSTVGNKRNTQLRYDFAAVAHLALGVTPGSVLGSQQLCSGESPSVISQIPAQYGGTLTYTWYRDGVEIPNTNVAAYTPATTTTPSSHVYTRSVTIPCEAPIASIGSHLITVYAPFSAGSIATIGESVCARDPLSTIGSTAVASGGSGTITYQWLVNGEVIEGANASTYTPLPISTAGIYIFTRKAKDQSCSGGYQTSAGSWTVVVKENPSVVISAPTAVCEGTEVTLIASGANTYDWYEGSTHLGAGASMEVIPTSTSIYRVVGTHTNGCQSSFTMSTPITIWSLPSLTISAPTSDLCPKVGNIELTANLGSGTIPYNLSWTGDLTYSYPVQTGITATTISNYASVPSTSCNQNYTIQAKVTDDKGCETTASTTIAVVDTTAPTIGDLSSLSRRLTSTNCDFAVPNFKRAVLALTADNCTPNEDLHYTQTPGAGIVLTVPGDYTISVKLVDDCGNEATNSQIVITVPPKPALTIVSAESHCYDTDDGVITYQVASGTPSYDVSLAGGTTQTHAAAGTYSFTHLADGYYTITSTDNNGCTHTVSSQIAQIANNLVITAASAIKSYDGTPLTKAVYHLSFLTESYLDIPSGTSQVLLNGDTVTAIVSGSQTEVGSGDNVVVSVKVKRAGVDKTCEYPIVTNKGTLTVIEGGHGLDTEPPCIGCGLGGVSCDDIGNQMRNNDPYESYYTHSGTEWDVTATDNSGETPTLQWLLTGATSASGNTTLDGQRFNIGVTIVKWTATDANNNTTQCLFQVTIVDNESPTLTCPTVATVYPCTTDVPAPYVNYAAFVAAGGSASGNHALNESSFGVTSEVFTGSNCAGTLTRTYSVADMHGSSSTCDQVIQIEDTIAPVLTGSWPSDITGQDNCFENRDISDLLCCNQIEDLFADCSTIEVENVDAVILTDNCGWKVTRTYTIKDACGNVAAGPFTMSISGSDQTPPTFIPPADSEICREADGTSYNADSAITGVPTLVSDDCALPAAVSVTYSDAVAQMTPEGVTTVTRTWRATDPCGNFTTHDQTITVVSSLTTAGILFTCPAPIDITLPYNVCDTLVTLGTPTYSTLPSGMTVTITNDAPLYPRFGVGHHVVTWRLTDERCGHYIECQQSVDIRFPPCGTISDSITDVDGYKYSTVRIGCQCWTGENLRSVRYSDYAPIANYHIFNHSDSLEKIYGKLYTWYSAVRVLEGDDGAIPAALLDVRGGRYVQGVCPEGWALPTPEEYAAMLTVSGGVTHVKSGSPLYWVEGAAGTPPYSGFEARGAGYYSVAASRYEGLLSTTKYWTSHCEPITPTSASAFELNYHCYEVLTIDYTKPHGLSIRCIRK